MSKDIKEDGKKAVAFSKHWEQAYVLNAEAAKRIWDSLSPEGDVMASANCAGGTKLEFTKLKSLVEHSNPKSEQIESLTFICNRASIYSNSVVVDFHEQDDLGPSITLNMSGTYSGNKNLRDKLIEEVDESKPAYSWITRFPVSWVLSTIAAFLVLQFVVDPVFGVLNIQVTELSYALKMLIIILIAILLPVIWFICYRAINPIILKILPKNTFAIGRGLERYESNKINRRILLGAVLAAVISILVGALFAL